MPNKITQAMLMGAGLGQRLRPFTDFCPKVLMPVMGIPVAQYSVDALVAAGVEKIVANYHHLPEQSKLGLKNLDLPSHTKLILSDESDLLLGSSGAYKKALPH